MGNRRRGRVLAFQALYWWDLARPASEALLAAAGGSDVFQDEPSDSDEPHAKDFARLLIAGTLEEIEAIDEHIRSQLRHWDFSRLAKVDLAILRISVYALLWQREIPAGVTIDEAVEIARDYGGEESYRFVNGVLDGIRKGVPA